ncbi:hypothetical protein D1872_301440 [compost metagenome]
MLQQIFGLRFDNVCFHLDIAYWMNRLKVESPLECSAHLVDTFVTNVRRSNDIEARLREQYPTFQLRYAEYFVTQDAYETILYLGGTACNLLKASNHPLLHSLV